MKKDNEKKLKLRFNLLDSRITENRKLIPELQAKKDAIYETTKDFKLSANKTDLAIKKMREIDSEKLKLSRKIVRDEAELDSINI